MRRQKNRKVTVDKQNETDPYLGKSGLNCDGQSSGEQRRWSDRKLCIE